MKLLVGLGNPGVKYERNRHNIGFMAIDEIWQRSGIAFQPWRKKFQAEFAEGSWQGDKIFLLKPQTYMNESGRSVVELVNFYKINPEDVICFHDELDLAPAKMKIKKGGGHAGHNGLRSMISLIGADFMRVRLGIGHPGQKELVAGYVLHDFSKADFEWIEKLTEGMARNLDPLLEDNAPGFSSEVARFINPPKSKSVAPKEKSKDESQLSRQPAKKQESEGTFKDVLNSLKNKFNK